MNIFVIPSWYPSKYSPLSGIFFKEQALALGHCRGGWNVALSTWGQGDYRVSLEHPLRSLSSIVDLLISRKPRTQSLLPNVIEYCDDCIEWNCKTIEYLSEANMRSCERNYHRFRSDFGDVDIIHAHVSYPAGWIAMHLSRKTGIPYVITEHMGPFPFSPFLADDGSLRDKIRLPLEQANSVIAVSPVLAERIMSFGISRPRYIPNLVDESFFEPGPAPTRNGVFTFFALGWLIDTKGFPELLQGISSILASLSPDEQTRVTFRIGGSGPEKLRYHLLAEELGVASRIEWLGLLERHEVRRELQGCDCFILASHCETFGVVFAEAIACGKPVIATRCGGPETIVTPGNGILVDVGSVEQISGALIYMFQNAHRYDQTEIRKDFIDRFSREVVVGQLEDEYCSVLERKLSCAA